MTLILRRVPWLLRPVAVLTATVLAMGCAARGAANHDASPEDAVASLLAADRAFAAAGAQRELPDAIGAMLDPEVVMLAAGAMVRGADSAVARLRANPRNAGARMTWSPIRGGVSSDGTHGFTYGYITTAAADGATAPGKYVAYWRRGASGWRVAAYKRAPRPAGEVSLAERSPARPARGLPIYADAELSRAREELKGAERDFCRMAQERGFGAAFEHWASADAAHLGGPDDAEFRFGPAAIGAGLGGPLPAGLTVTWIAEDALVARSGDLGVTFGTITSTQAASGAQAEQVRRVPYFTIWRRADTAAPWRYVIE